MPYSSAGYQGELITINRVEMGDLVYTRMGIFQHQLFPEARGGCSNTEVNSNSFDLKARRLVLVLSNKNKLTQLGNVCCVCGLHGPDVSLRLALSI